jgi:ABC-2 type transport system ATP-binding protein
LVRSSTAIDDAPAIRLAGAGRSFGGVRALVDVDCVVGPGELVALVGANGSGKSTLLRLLAGVVTADEGIVEVFGRAPSTRDASFRASTGYAGQELALDGEITGRETLRLFYALRGLPHRERDARLATIIEEFELASFYERRVGGYSGGQRQRLHLALETLHAPSLLLLDEPTSSLDPAGRAALWRRLASWRDRGHAIVIVTHDLPDAEAHCDRVLLLHEGRVLADAAPGALVASHGRARTTIELDAPQRDVVALRDALERVSPPGRVEIDETLVTITRTHAIDGPEPALDLLRERGVNYTRYEQHRSDLASAFFELTGARLASSPQSETIRQARRSSGGGRGAGTGGGHGRGGAR